MCTPEQAHSGHCRFGYLVSKDSFWADDFIKDVLTHVRVHSGQWVIQEVNISLSVDGPGQAHSLLLPSREIQSLH